MQGNNEAFTYDDVNLARLEAAISAERLAPYLAMAQGDRRYAIALYEWNTRVSEALYGLIQGLEVALRNSFHGVLTTAFGTEDWFGIAPLLPEQKQQVEQARKRITGDGREVTAGRVIAELMFGFWTSLVGTAYAQILWDKCLYKAFPSERLSRKEVAKTLNTIRLLRNRVAHHESIIGKAGRPRDLKHDVSNVIGTLGWICPTTASWVAQTNSFDLQYASRPREPNLQPNLPQIPF